MIKENVQKILSKLPPGIKLVVAAKNRTPQEILEAIEAGIEIIGENYIKETKKAYQQIGKKVKWHFIGIPKIEKHDLLRKKNLEIFDLIETIDSLEIAKEINQKCKDIGKIMEILIEINSGKEPQKSGVMPEKAKELIKEVSKLSNLKVKGLMTMGPRFLKNPQEYRDYFAQTRKLFEEIKSSNLTNVQMEYLSMGMSDSYKIALEEGANIIRIGTKIFEGGD